eukprot:m.25005 g.25005  ORF g.25005 m.25005 type:complete len:366 (-) comp8669_c0_seq2:1284-2381(-)
MASPPSRVIVAFGVLGVFCLLLLPVWYVLVSDDAYVYEQEDQRVEEPFLDPWFLDDCAACPCDEAEPCPFPRSVLAETPENYHIETQSGLFDVFLSIDKLNVVEPVDYADPHTSLESDTASPSVVSALCHGLQKAVLGIGAHPYSTTSDVIEQTFHAQSSPIGTHAHNAALQVIFNTTHNVSAPIIVVVGPGSMQIALAIPQLDSLKNPPRCIVASQPPLSPATKHTSAQDGLPETVTALRSYPSFVAQVAGTSDPKNNLVPVLGELDDVLSALRQHSKTGPTTILLLSPPPLCSSKLIDGFRHLGARGHIAVIFDNVVPDNPSLAEIEVSKVFKVLKDVGSQVQHRQYKGGTSVFIARKNQRTP